VEQFSLLNSLKQRTRTELSLFEIEGIGASFIQAIESLKKVGGYWHSQFFEVSGIITSFLIVVGKREKLLINLPSFINIGMQVNFRCLDRGVAKIFLYNPEIL